MLEIPRGRPESNAGFGIGEILPVPSARVKPLDKFLIAKRLLLILTPQAKMPRYPPRQMDCQAKSAPPAGKSMRRAEPKGAVEGSMVLVFSTDSPTASSYRWLTGGVAGRRWRGNAPESFTRSGEFHGHSNARIGCEGARIYYASRNRFVSIRAA